MTTDDKYKTLDRVINWVSNCENKVSYLLALQGIILTIIFTSNNTTCIIRTFSYNFSLVDFVWTSVLRFFEGICLYTFFILNVLSLYNAFLTLKARLNPSIYKEHGLNTNSVLFFESIANRTFNDFVTDQQTTTTNNQLDNDIDSQVFINSKICQLKFKHYNLALKYYGIGSLIGLTYLILAIINGRLY